MTLSLEDRVKRRAIELGFSDVGIAPVRPSDHRALYEWWIDRGYHGEMGYLAREDSLARRFDLGGTLESARSAVVVAHDYGGIDEGAHGGDPASAVLARYARGDDYHDVMLPKLKALRDWLEKAAAGAMAARPYVDTGPLLERELAWRAGLGWQARNTMLIHPQRGSYFFLGVLLTDLQLESDEPLATDRCGTCTACVEECPTGALLDRRADGAPVMDARRCISYLTIELRSAIPLELRPAVGNRVFGCDICQEVCPWNLRFSREGDEPRYAPRSDLDDRDLIGLTTELLTLDDDGFRERFRGSPVWRTRRHGLLRNLCVGLGNGGGHGAVAVLVRALSDPHPLVRGHAAWALGRIGGPDATAALADRAVVEDDESVAREISMAMSTTAA